MKKKLLIYFQDSLLRPVGGPAGYLYNLKNGLDLVQADRELQIDIAFYENAPKRLSDTVKFKDKIPKRVREFKRAWDDIFYKKKKYPYDAVLAEYDMIHFHVTDEMYLNRDTLKDYKGKVILTSHSPCVMYKEKLAWLNPVDYKLFKSKVERIEEIDSHAFDRADFIIFPCKEAEEPYFHTWDKYPEIRVENKYRYLPTGIVGCHAKIDRVEFRKKWNIPEDAFVVSYVGRHNEIKGYADLKKLGVELLKDKNIYFVVAGKEEPLTGLNHDHWIEVGWTNDPHSLIAASDVFVLPNHETYFDLILLEVISLGTPVVMSETGGNKFFRKFEEPGLKYYQTLDEAENAILEFKNTENTEITVAKERLLKLFKNEFLVEKFARRYVDIITEIANL